jgi:taurine dioxygenase
MGEIMRSYETITVEPSSPHVGAEIGNIDLRETLSNRQVDEVHQALLDHGVIFFREQPISFEQHRRLAMYFGELHIHVGGKGTASKPADGFPEIRRQHFDANSKRVSGEVWHTDQSCADIPPMGSILHQHVVPPKGGGDTMFASAYAAYDALSDRMKHFLEGLTAEHDGNQLFDKNSGTEYPIATHPVVTVHPETGRKILFVNRGQTTRIHELPRNESDGILAMLFDHIEKPAWQMRFRWRSHSIAFWDNRCTQHQAIWDYWPETRTGYRIQIQGTERPKAA